MKRLKKIGILLIVVILVLGLMYYLGFRQGQIEEKPQINSATVKHQIESISELASSSYYYTNVGSFENQNEFRGFKIPLTQKSFIISYDGLIKAGVDLKDVEVMVSEDQIRIKLPDSQILSHEIDEDSISIFDEKNSIFNPIDVSDYSEFVKSQKSLMEEKALDSGLLETASKETQRNIREVLTLNDQINSEYTIVFE